MVKIVARGRLCALAEMEYKYLPRHVEFLKNPLVTRYVRIRSPITLKSQRSWLRRIRRSDSDLVFAILSIENGKPGQFIGVAGLHDLDRIDRTARGGLIIGDSTYWGRGIATEARFLQLRFAFRQLKLRWVWGSTISPNKRSRRLLARTGYIEIGLRPRSRKSGREFHDEILYAISGKSWKNALRQYETSRT